MGRQLVTFGNNTYTYNEDGIRTSKTVDNVTTTYYLDETNIIEQITGNTVLHFYYDSNNEIIGFEYNGANYYYVKNAMSDIVGITDSDGNLITSYQYDPWGKVLSVTGSDTIIDNLNPFRCRSYYYDVETGFYYLQSRYYDPEVGRFINCDDVNYIGLTESEVSYNPFAYCENDPVNDSDPSGTIAISTCVIIGACIGAIIGGATGYCLAKKNGYTVKDGCKFWKYICGGITIGGVAGGILGYIGGALFGATGIKAGTLASKISMSKIRYLRII